MAKSEILDCLAGSRVNSAVALYAASGRATPVREGFGSSGRMPLTRPLRGESYLFIVRVSYMRIEFECTLCILGSSPTQPLIT
jgi:hypothetical protein